MATPYKTKTFTIASGATESSAVLLLGEGEAGLTIHRIDIDGALTSQVAWLTDCETATGTYKDVYDEFGTRLTFTIGGNRGHRIKMSDWAIVKPAMKVNLTGAASGAVTGKIYYRVAQ